jgi:hypothetical protein
VNSNNRCPPTRDEQHHPNCATQRILLKLARDPVG